MKKRLLTTMLAIMAIFGAVAQNHFVKFEELYDEIKAEAEAGGPATINGSGNKYDLNADRVLDIFTLKSPSNRTLRIDKASIGFANGVTTTIRLETNGASNTTNGRKIYINCPGAGTLTVGGYTETAGRGYTLEKEDGTVLSDIAASLPGTTSDERQNLPVQTYQITEAGIVVLNPNAAIYYGFLQFEETSVADPSITSFKIGELEADIDEEAGAITAELPQGSALTAITPIVELGGSATSYTPTDAQDFTNPVIYTAFNADKTASKEYSVTLTVAVTLSDDATLKSLKYKDALVSNFAPETYEYSIELPYGSAVPAVTDVTAEANHVNATVAAPVRSSDAFPTNISVIVTAENELATQTYVIHFTQTPANTDATLKTLKVNGAAITLVADKTDYTVDLPHTTTTVPTVEATTNDAKATAVITQATSLEGNATVVVTAEDGVTKGNYTVGFHLLPPPEKPVTKWVVGNDDINFPAGQLDWTPDADAKYTTPITIQGLTINNNTTNKNMGEVEKTSSSVSFEDTTYPNRFKLNGAGYTGAANTDEAPADNMPTQRYLSFEVSGNSIVTLRGTTGSNSAARKIFLTDGTALIGAYSYPAVDKTTVFEESVSYAGPAATLYLFGNTACNLYEISVETDSDVSIANVTSGNKEVKSVSYYDVLGRPVNASAKGLVIVKTTYTDGTSASAKVYRLDK